MGLATFRISNLIADEPGPLGLFEWFRVAVGVRRDNLGRPYGLNNFAAGLCCVWCNSVWVGVILTIGYVLARYVTVLACFPFALSAIALVIAEAVKLGVVMREIAESEGVNDG